MEIILNYKNGNYILEKVEGKRVNRTNNQQRISGIINNVKISAINATYHDKFVKMYFGDNRYIILKDLDKNKNLELYSIVLNCINENTRVVKNINNVNKTRLKLITGLTIASLTITSFVSIGKKNQSINRPPINNTSVETVLPTDIPSINSIPESEVVISTLTPPPAPTATPKINEIKDFEDRFTESMLISKSNRTDFVGIPLATNFNDDFCKKALECSKSDIWFFSNKYGSDFGVDPYLPYSLFYGETDFEHEKTLPGGSSYNGSAVGIGQHENPDGTNAVTAFNYNTNQYETEIISMENACDLEKNIKMAIMLLQNKLKKYKGNIYVAIQSYNYGDGAMNIILTEYAKEKNITIDEILNDYSDTGWLKYVEHFHYNPGQYLSNWKYKTYGDPNYVNKIMGYYIGTESTNTLPDGTKVTINLISCEKTYEAKTY